MASRCILILLDGLGDRSYPVLGDQTPLQAARTPNLDALAARGMNGLYHGDHWGIAFPSEQAHFALFGYTQSEFPGRGVLEAIGAGIEVPPEDVALLAHLISVSERDGTLVLEKDRPPAGPEEIAELARAVEKFEESGVRIRYLPTRHLDGILLLSGPVSTSITDSDPIREGKPLIEVSPLHSAATDPAAVTTARVLKNYLLWCFRTLASHPLNQERIENNRFPINAVATQRPGRYRTVDSFPARWGLKALSITSSLVYWGLGAFLGIDVHKVPDNPDGERDLEDRLRVAMDFRDRYDFIHVHTKSPATAAHTKDPLKKVKAIEEIDRSLGGIMNILLQDPELLIVITSDHSTPCHGPLIHSGETVPIMMIGPGVRRDPVQRFDEINCAGGALGTIRGVEFMYLVLNFLDRAKLVGLMDTPYDQPYWPGPYLPFRTR